MITKAQFCKMTIEKFIEEDEDLRKKYKWNTLPEEEVYKSSSLGVAMEHLGLLSSPEIKDYVDARAGTIFTWWDKESNEVALLTTRELIDLLPE